MDTKMCRQCGEIKPIEQFRQYYGGRKGTYTICRSCEKINSRAKYLEKKGSDISAIEQAELNKIYRLYDAQKACGLRPPRRDEGRSTSLVDNLDNMISNYEKKANEMVACSDTLDTKATPAELQQWLTCDLTEEPDYYLDDVYEELKAKYRPVLRIDADTMLPVHDDKHSAVLDLILDRFNDYEDKYYQED